MLLFDLSMAMSLKEFQEHGTGTREQFAVVETLMDLAEQEPILVEAVNAAHRPYQEMADRERRRWFPQNDMSGLIIDQEIMPAGYRAAAPHKRKLDELHQCLGETLKTAAKLGLDHLTFVQRNYEQFVGEPLY